MEQLCNARGVIVEICNARGYEQTQEVLRYPEFTEKFPNAPNNASILNFVTRNAAGESVAVHFVHDETLAKSSIERIFADYAMQGIPRLILITTQKLSPACRSVMVSSKILTEHFLTSEIQVNITRHELVSPHRILSKEETARVLEKYRATPDQLPAILTTDIMCRYIGGEVGDVIEIERQSPTAGRALYYRVVHKG